MLRPYRGRLPVVDPTAYVDASAQVIGDVEIGVDSSVWMNVVVRGDVNHIRIGRRSNVQDGTIVHVMHEAHPTVIGDDVTIGHAAVVTDARLKTGC
jgi:carbonic anhydrase/acetyltransferase-like protein (isoleucine patch superfamily)